MHRMLINIDEHPNQMALVNLIKLKHFFIFNRKDSTDCKLQSIKKHSSDSTRERSDQGIESNYSLGLDIGK